MSLFKSNFNFFLVQRKKKEPLKKYKKLSYEESILQAALELKNINTLYKFIPNSNHRSPQILRSYYSQNSLNQHKIVY